MDTNILEQKNDFFTALHSIPTFKPDTSVKGSIINIRFSGTSVDILLDSQILIVVGNHAEFALAIGRKLKAPYCYWCNEKEETIIAFGKKPTNFVDKCKVLVMMFAILPLTLVPEVYSGKKFIIYKHYDEEKVSLYLTKDVCIFVKECIGYKPYIKELEGGCMEEELKDPKVAEKKLDELTEASNKQDKENETPIIKPKAVYGDVVEQD